MKHQITNYTVTSKCIHVYVRQGWTNFPKTSSPPKILRVGRCRTFHTGNPQTVSGPPFTVQNVSKQAAWLRESVQRSSGMNSWFDRTTVHIILFANAQHNSYIIFHLSIPVAARPKAWVCGRSLAGPAFSNPAGGMNVCFLYVVCAVRQRSQRRADQFLFEAKLLQPTTSYHYQQLISSYPSISVEVLKVFSSIRVFW